MSTVVLAVVVLALVLEATGTPWRRVGRVRLDRFARRQSLPITVENGPLVIRYLATTRRWRGGGLILGLVAAAGWQLVTSAQLPPEKIEVSFLALFAGWFAGAIVAEWRIASMAREPGPRRSAALEPRRLADYLPRPSRALPVLAWGVLAAAELAGLAGLVTRREQGILLVLGWIGLTALAGAVLVAVGRQVLVRPQRYPDDALITADDALRSRSLHVLAGSALAIAGYLLAALAHALTRYSPMLSGGVGTLIAVLGSVVVPILGFALATAPAGPLRRRQPAIALESPG